jgi:hypothetical protein
VSTAIVPFVLWHDKAGLKVQGALLTLAAADAVAAYAGLPPDRAPTAASATASSGKRLALARILCISKFPPGIRLTFYVYA